MAEKENPLLKKKRELEDQIAQINVQIKAEIQAFEDQADQLRRAAGLEEPGYIPQHMKPAARQKAAANPDRVCKVCGAVGHDGRFHKGDKKKAEPAAADATKPRVAKKADA